jgi:hypothetical protein
LQVRVLANPEYRLALHICMAIYGNIGTADRLDFTVIGLAVNLVNTAAMIADDEASVVVLDGPGWREVARSYRFQPGAARFSNADAGASSYTDARGCGGRSGHRDHHHRQRRQRPGVRRP